MFSVWRSFSCIVGKILPLTEAKTFSATVCPSIFLAGCLSVQVVVEVRLCLFIVLILLSQAMLRYFWYFMVSYGMAWKERYLLLLLLLLFVARLKIFGYRYQTPSVREKNTFYFYYYDHLLCIVGIYKAHSKTLLLSDPMGIFRVPPSYSTHNNHHSNRHV